MGRERSQSSRRKADIRSVARNRTIFRSAKGRFANSTCSPKAKLDRPKPSADLPDLV